MIQAPTNPEAMLKTLQELSRLSGKDLVSEGYEVWGVEPPATQPESKGSEDNILLLAEIFDKIAELPVEARKLLVALIVSP